MNVLLGDGTGKWRRNLTLQREDSSRGAVLPQGLRQVRTGSQIASFTVLLSKQQASKAELSSTHPGPGVHSPKLSLWHLKVLPVFLVG